VGVVVENPERKWQQRAARDKQLSEIENSLTRATDLINESKREVQRSRDLMDSQKAQNQRDDEAEDARERLRA
jgi:hypothetical protein